MLIQNEKKLFDTGLDIKTAFVLGLNRPKIRLETVRGIVLHSVGLKQDPFVTKSAWDAGVRYGSAHFIVKGNKVLYTIPLNEIAYHVGSSQPYTACGSKFITIGKPTPNYSLLGIEMAEEQFHEISGMTCNTVGILCKSLMNIFHLSKEDIYTHFDITGKLCPLYNQSMQYWITKCAI